MSRRHTPRVPWLRTRLRTEELELRAQPAAHGVIAFGLVDVQTDIPEGLLHAAAVVQSHHDLGGRLAEVLPAATDPTPPGVDSPPPGQGGTPNGGSEQPPVVTPPVVVDVPGNGGSVKITVDQTGNSVTITIATTLNVSEPAPTPAPTATPTADTPAASSRAGTRR